MKNISSIIFVSLLLCSCAQEVEEVKQDNPLFSRSRATTLTKLRETINLEDLGIYNPTKVIKKDSLLIVLDLEGANKISIYHQNGQLLESYLPVGVGENEALYILTMNLDQNGIITAYDFGNDKMIEFDLKQFGQPNFGPTMTHLPTDKKHLSVAKSGSTLVSTGLFYDARYSLINNGTENYFLTYPEVPGYEGIGDTLKSALHANNIIKIKPDGSKFVCASTLSGIIDLCSLIPCNTITRINEQNLYSPIATVGKTRRRPLSYSADNLTGFVDIEVTDDYIYALYSGRSYRKYKEKMLYGERVIKFDWEGNHICTYLLRIPFTTISFSQEENAIYGLTNHPNSVLIKYALD